MTLRSGNKGQDVLQLTADLVTLGLLASPGSIFNADVVNAVKKFQAQNLDPLGAPLVIDGEVGPLTKYAMDVVLGRRAPTASPATQPTPVRVFSGGSKSGNAALQVAIAEMDRGAGEQGGDNLGPDVEKYLNGLAPAGSSWCAGFVSYCFANSTEGIPFKYSVGAQDILGQFKKKGWLYTASVTNPPEPGDIIVFTRATKQEPWLGHIGLVNNYADGIVTTIEGNRGPYPSKVTTFTYVLGRIANLLSFGQAQP
jgi:CHAP domain